MVSNSEEFKDLLDLDEDGMLNEDEQILIFSIIKERMQNCAYELCDIHEYVLFQELMLKIRELEQIVFEYQADLRENVNCNELKLCREIGNKKLEEFKH